MVKGQLHGMHSGGGSPFSKNSCVRQELSLEDTAVDSPVIRCRKRQLQFAIDTETQLKCKIGRQFRTGKKTCKPMVSE